MKRILVVDDEILVRVGLRALVDWHAEGYEIVGEAASGREAEELLLDLEPDIVLTDLAMGPGDGFALIEAIRARSPATGIVILSCRNDFDAVREALRLGADDYVFKLTMKSEEILDVLHRVSSKVDVRRAAAGGKVSSAKATAESEDGGKVSRGGLAICRYAAGDVDALADASAFAQGHNLPPGFFRAYRVALFSLCGLPPGEDRTPVEPEVFLQAVRELKRRGLPEFEVYPYEGARALVLLRGAYRGTPGEVAAGIDEYARRYFGRQAIGGVSTAMEGLESLPTGTAQAEEALASSFYLGPGFREISELPEKRDLDESSLIHDRSDFLRSLRCLDGEGMERALRACIAKLELARGQRPERLLSLAWDFLAPLRDRARAACVDCDYPSGDAAQAGSGLEPVSAQLLFLMAPDLPFFESFAVSYLQKISTAISSLSQARCRPEIRKVMDLVRGDPSRNLGVEEAASIAAMSPSHFEHQFKKQTGVGFVRFVTLTRVERAIELLSAGGKRINEIARELGYENPNYFSTVFKQVTGRTPQESRGGASLLEREQKNRDHRRNPEEIAQKCEKSEKNSNPANSSIRNQG